MKLKINLVEGGKLPEKMTEGSELDCYVRKYEIADSGQITYWLGFKLEFPYEYRCKIAPRSGLSKSIFVMQNSEGIGDADFRGEYSFKIRPLLDLRNNEFFAKQIAESSIPYNVGDRCCQIYFEKKEEVEMDIVDTLSETERGDGSYGHTDNK